MIELSELMAWLITFAGNLRKINVEIRKYHQINRLVDSYGLWESNFGTEWIRNLCTFLDILNELMYYTRMRIAIILD